jgi:acyl-CoA dehydrogenase
MSAVETSSVAMSADPMVVETVERLLTDVSTQDEVEHAEASGWSQATWQALAEAGFAWVGIDDAKGGSGGSLHDLAAILRSVGAHAASVPIAETAMLGGWMLAEAGLPLPDGPVAVTETTGAIAIDGKLVLDKPVAWARHADRIVTLLPIADDGIHLVSLRPDQVTITPGGNLAGEARDGVVVDAPSSDWDTVRISDGRSLGEPWNTIRLRGSLSRTLLAAGALATMSQMSIDYTNERRQFGKPVATFQAVQMHLVTAAQCAVKAQMAADIAVRALECGGGRHEIAAARVIVDDAITVGTRAAHQAHGAMGVTREYPLHQLTRRLWSWRQEWGTTRQWRRELGSTVVARGADELFDLVTETSTRHPSPRS